MPKTRERDLGYNSSVYDFNTGGDLDVFLIAKDIDDLNWKSIDKHLKSKKHLVVNAVFSKKNPSQELLEFVCLKGGLRFQDLLSGMCEEKFNVSSVAFFVNFFKRQGQDTEKEAKFHSEHYTEEYTQSLFFTKMRKQHLKTHALNYEELEVFSAMKFLLHRDMFQSDYFSLLCNEFPKVKHFLQTNPKTCLSLLGREFNGKLDAALVEMFENAEWMDIFKEAFGAQHYYAPHGRPFEIDNALSLLDNAKIGCAYSEYTEMAEKSNATRNKVLDTLWGASDAPKSTAALQEIVKDYAKDNLSKKQCDEFLEHIANLFDQFSYQVSLTETDELVREHIKHHYLSREWERVAPFLTIHIPNYYHPNIADLFLENTKTAHQILLGGNKALRDVILSPQKNHVLRNLFRGVTMEEFFQLVKTPGVREWKDEEGTIPPVIYLSNSTTRGYNFLHKLYEECPEWAVNEQVVKCLKKNGMTNEVYAKFQKQTMLRGLKTDEGLRKMLTSRKKTPPKRRM